MANPAPFITIYANLDIAQLVVGSTPASVSFAVADAVANVAAGPTFITADLVDVNLQLPIRGLWTADIITTGVPSVEGATTTNPTPGFGAGSACHISLGGDWVFLGQILRYGVWRDSIHARVVGSSFNWASYPVNPLLQRKKAVWYNLYQELAQSSWQGTQFVYSPKLALENNLDSVSISPSGSRRASDTMNVLTYQLNRKVFTDAVAKANIVATPQGKVFAALFTKLGILPYLNWRVLPLSQTIYPALANNKFLPTIPIITLADDFEPYADAGAYPGASYWADVQGHSEVKTLAQVNALSIGGPYLYALPLIDSTATLRDISSEAGLESYGVEYPVILPGNWYNSPVAIDAFPLAKDAAAFTQYNTKNSFGEPQIQAQDVEYRFRDSRLQMTIHTRSALQTGPGRSAYTVLNQTVA
jgi:hypothetical protein